jgi:hypothetical protein
VRKSIRIPLLNHRQSPLDLGQCVLFCCSNALFSPSVDVWVVSNCETSHNLLVVVACCVLHVAF